MGDRARQRQELELWQVVSPPEKRRKNNISNMPAPYAVNPRKPRNTRPNPSSVNNAARKRMMQKRKAARRRQVRLYRILTAVWFAVIIAAVVFAGRIIYQSVDADEDESKAIKAVLDEIPIIRNNSDAKKPEITEDFLTISEYNRPGTRLYHVNSIFVHYTANPGTSAAQNRSYFQNLGETHERAASAHFIIGYEGEIIQCIPLDEEAYAVIDRNKDSVSIECCYINEDGSFTQETYDSLVAMLAWLTDKYNLDTKDILRHYDCGGKLCPVYYVEHEDAWNKLLSDVENYKQ